MIKLHMLKYTKSTLQMKQIHDSEKGKKLQTKQKLKPKTYDRKKYISIYISDG